MCPVERYSRKERPGRLSAKGGQRFKREEHSPAFAGLEDGGEELQPGNSGSLQKTAAIPG